MEIERKWIVTDEGEFCEQMANLNAKLVGQYEIDQFYISTRPEVRLRKCVPVCGPEKSPYKMTIKGHGTLSRTEIEQTVLKSFYEQTKLFVGLPPISKSYAVYNLDGYKLEVSNVEGQFTYIEVEFDSEKQAYDYQLPFTDCVTEVTDDPKYKMRRYWEKTRLGA